MGGGGRGEGGKENLEIKISKHMNESNTTPTPKNLRTAIITRFQILQNEEPKIF